jgi:hypothetical protein
MKHDITTKKYRKYETWFISSSSPNPEAEGYLQVTRERRAKSADSKANRKQEPAKHKT